MIIANLSLGPSSGRDSGFTHSLPFVNRLHPRIPFFVLVVTMMMVMPVLYTNFRALPFLPLLSLASVSFGACEHLAES